MRNPQEKKTPGSGIYIKRNTNKILDKHTWHVRSCHNSNRYGHKTILPKRPSQEKATHGGKQIGQKIEEDLEHLADEINKTKKQFDTEELWITFKESIQQSMDKSIPSK